MSEPTKELPFNEKVAPPTLPEEQKKELPYGEKAPARDLEEKDAFPGVWWGLGYQFTDMPSYIKDDSHGVRFDFNYTNRKLLFSIPLGDFPLPVSFSPKLEGVVGSAEHFEIGTGMTVNIVFPDLLFFYVTPMLHANWIEKKPVGSFSLPFGVQVLLAQKPMFGAFVEYGAPAVMWGNECPPASIKEDTCDRFSLQKFDTGIRWQF